MAVPLATFLPLAVATSFTLPAPGTVTFTASPLRSAFFVVLVSAMLAFGAGCGAGFVTGGGVCGTGGTL